MHSFMREKSNCVATDMMFSRGWEGGGGREGCLLPAPSPLAPCSPKTFPIDPTLAYHPHQSSNRSYSTVAIIIIIFYFICNIQVH